MSNPDVGPRCGECRMGLGIHNTADPLCDHHDKAPNPLYLGDPDDHCPTCGCRLRDNRLQELKPCPWGPHTKDAA